ncbi:hypothetical protein MTX78_11710 [Hymenobacter tibetensis]|uniref:Uncharacterized protein n=1 Tax=Hymenobacter tibetensis TaxID=497967 RepID=A0ABY4CSP9_9BACT|nr:hypothetical protein [Hymenobacter tibetensis]UOG72792.1 hypothetical protein MTX78_11710 [Hymenobacter tibetensis]
MNSLALFSSPSRPLTRQQRAWIALYSLLEVNQNRAEVLHLNDVTEEDLLEFEESWQLLRNRLPYPHYLLPRFPLPELS